ncbi:MAG: response regulator transcription factor [Candidatus Eremiobacteraeota bacterium]|nr:response regulator transcription factor [Candidatus Eremiobacteraeota bacterium]
MVTTIETAVRIMVIEGQELFGKALCQLLSSDADINVVGDSQSVVPAELTRAAPDLVLIDLDGHSFKIDDAMAQCREAVPNARVCVLSTQLRPEILQRCVAAGAMGYIIKDVPPSELIRALKIVAAGGSYVDPRIAGELLQRRNGSNGKGHLYELTPRENEVVCLIAEGLSNKAISEKLHLSDKTVKNHISHIFSKLNITARSQAAVHAIRCGLV